MFDRFFKRQKPEEGATLALMYHSVEARDLDPWALAVTPDHFSQQLEIVKKEFKPYPVSALVNALEAGRSLGPGSVVITFDDGYANNLQTAAPLLAAFDCPATFFIPSAFLDRSQGFWWDELADLILQPPLLPDYIHLQWPNQEVKFSLSAGARLSREDARRHKNWVWPQPAPTIRAQLYLDIWYRLKQTPLPMIEEVMGRIRTWAGTPPGIASRPLTTPELISLASGPGVEIGWHTMTHPALSGCDPLRQEEEIRGSGNELNRLISGVHPHLAYPYGDHSNETMEIAKKAGLKAAFTTREKRINLAANRFALGRFQVKNWDSKKFKAKIRDWSSARHH